MQRDANSYASPSDIAKEMVDALGLQGRKVLSIDLKLRAQALPELTIREAVTNGQGQALGGMLRSRFTLLPIGAPESMALGSTDDAAPDLVEVMAALRALSAEVQALRAEISRQATVGERLVPAGSTPSAAELSAAIR